MRYELLLITEPRRNVQLPRWRRPVQIHFLCQIPS